MTEVIRFLAGLGLGAAASGVTWALWQSPHWTWVVGLLVAVLVWFGEFLDELL